MYLFPEQISAFIKDCGFSCTFCWMHAFSTSSRGGNFLLHSLFCQLLFVSTANTRKELSCGPLGLYWLLQSREHLESGAEKQVGQPKDYIVPCVVPISGG